MIQSDKRGGRFVASIFGTLGKVYPFGKNRYLSYLFSRLGAKLASGSTCSLGLPGGGVFTFPMDDKYWLKLLMPGFTYEPEVDRTIQSLSDRFAGVLFLDCGSNFGYWVARASGMNNVDVVAIEPSPTALEYLRVNIAKSSRKVTLYEKAIWHETGATLDFASSATVHAGSSIADVARHSIGEGDWALTKVSTIDIDTIVRTHREPRHEIVAIKLDVEGAEVDAIEGGMKTLKSGDSVLIYEDHMSETEHRITQKLLDCGLNIYCFNEDKLERVPDVQRLAKLKLPRVTNYNFNNYIACEPNQTGERALLALN